MRHFADEMRRHMGPIARIKSHPGYQGGDIAGPLTHPELDDLWSDWYVEMLPDRRVPWRLLKTETRKLDALPRDGDPAEATEEDPRHQRKGARAGDAA